MAALKGQNFRVFEGSSVVAEATTCTVTLTGNTEDMSTKDDVATASKPSITSKSWQVSVDSLDVTDLGTLLTAIKNGALFTVKWDQTSTSDNTTAESAGYSRSGQAYLSDLTVNFNDREWVTKSVQFTGSGPLT